MWRDFPCDASAAGERAVLYNERTLAYGTGTVNVDGVIQVDPGYDISAYDKWALVSDIFAVERHNSLRGDVTWTVGQWGHPRPSPPMFALDASGQLLVGRFVDSFFVTYAMKRVPEASVAASRAITALRLFASVNINNPRWSEQSREAKPCRVCYNVNTAEHTDCATCDSIGEKLSANFSAVQ